MTFKNLARIGALSALLFAPSVFADTVNMVMTGTVNSTVLGGVYVNPYLATINGVVTTVICDDFTAETYFNETWKATVTTFDQLQNDQSTVKFGGLPNALDRYNQAAWLSLQLLANLGTPNQGQISFAIWGLFTPSALNSISPVAPPGSTSAANWIAQAKNSGFVADSNFAIYTPVTGTARLNGVPMPTPQEFIVVRTPESSAVALLVFNLAAVGAVAYALRRRLVHPAN